MNLEDQLQETLRRAAAGDREPAVRLDDVRSRARRVRARRRASALAVAAAVVVVVGAPTALLVHDHGSTTPPPAHGGTPSPAPTPTPTSAPTPTTDPTPTTPSTPRPRTLASFPKGDSTFLSYVDGAGVVHSDGSTSTLPGQMAPDVQFHEFHGGWIVSGGGTSFDTRVYDDKGSVTARGQSGGMVVTGDRTRIAWLMGGKLYESGLSTMGIAPPTPTPDAVSVPPASTLIGYLPQGAALAKDSTVQIVEGGHLTSVPVGMLPTATSQAADLVAGVTGTVAKGDLAGSVVDLKTGNRLWQNSWRPIRFSDDGTLVAAAPVADNGDPSSIAILDARTGKVVAQTGALGSGLFLTASVAWDDHRLLFPAVGDHGKQAAVMALETSGTLSRVSDVQTSAQAGHAYVVFEAQP